MTATGFPTFDRPPVVEVGLIAQFTEPLPWKHVDAFAAAWPDYERHSRQVLTRMDLLPESGATADEDAPGERLWLENAPGSRVVQIQPDRLMVNWSDDDPTEDYPRYAQIREFFEKAWQHVESVAGTPLEPDICEVFYLNYITAQNGWTGPEDTVSIVAPWSGEMSNDFLPEPYTAATYLHFHVPEPCQWLDIEIGPLNVEEERMLVIHLASRGLAPSLGLNGALAVLNAAHEQIVKGFVSLTTEHAHAIWGLER